MKRTLFYLNIFFVVSLFLFSCEDITTKGVTEKITYYPVVTVKGASDTAIAVGASWSDPGANVSTGIPFTTNQISTATPGLKVVTYTAVNEDGFKSEASRNVFVVNAGNDNGIDRSGVYQGGRGTSYSKEKGDGSVTLSKTSVSGVYVVSDMHARYYEVWRDYGAAYRCPGVMRFNANNTVDMGGASYPSPWGDSGITPGSGAVDGNGRITYKLTLGGSPVAAEFFLEKQ